MEHSLKLRLENFRVFKKKVEFQINPITILTGPNNSGKSSLNKSILLMKEYFNQFEFQKEDNLPVGLSFLKGIHYLGKYSRAVNSNEKYMCFEYQFFNHLIDDEITLSIKFLEDKDSGDGRIDSFEIKFNEKTTLLVKYDTKQPRIFSSFLCTFEIDFAFFFERLRTISDKFKNSKHFNDSLKAEIKKKINILDDVAIENMFTSMSSRNSQKLILQSRAAKIIIDGYNKGCTAKEIFDLFVQINPKLNHMEDYSTTDIINVIDEIKVEDLNRLADKEWKYIEELSSHKIDFKGNFNLSISSRGDFQNLSNDLIEYFGIVNSLSTLIPDAKSGLDHIFDYVYTILIDTLHSLTNELKNTIHIPAIRTSDFFTTLKKEFIANQDFIRLMALAVNKKLEKKDGVAVKVISSDTNLKKEPQRVFGKNISEYLNKWINQFEIANDINILLDETGEDVKVYIINGNQKTLITDMGYGSSQLLPIILKFSLAMIPGSDLSSGKKIIIIEEPETNLHPRLQSLLADFFVDFQKRTRHFLIIETHSEYLIRKLQYLTAKKEIKPEDVIIYYFHKPNEVPKGEKQVKKIKIQEDGCLSDNFGPGFFDEADNLATQLFVLNKNASN